MSKKFDFKDLVVLDLANNHQGNVKHGNNIISSLADITKSLNVKAAIKFQFRDLPNFVHIDEQNDPKNKHVPRFLSTMLSWDQFAELNKNIQDKGLLSMCTPFDESSVARIVDMGFDIIKVASCSAKDWPLLEKVAASGLPVVASTGGLLENEVDDLVSFLTHKGCDFALMHCVAIYPTPDEYCNLANIKGFKERYPNLVIGWSTHEPPEETLHAGLASALGAEMFERHVGMEAEGIELNKYSSSPKQVSDWLNALLKARNLIGKERRVPASDLELESLDGLKRSVFAQKQIKAGENITEEDIYFAFPFRPGGLSSGEWKNGIISDVDIDIDQPLNLESLSIPSDADEMLLKKCIHEIKAMLAYAKIPLTSDFTTEYSHHFGVANFREVGCVLINVINRDYCKKILVQLPGQRHPSHYHKLKEETFLIVWGELISTLEGKEKVLQPGDTLTVSPGAWHSFKTDTGCIFEEISTTAFSNDSVYRDEAINALTSAQRKTVVDHWGRFQIKEQLRKANITS